MEKGANKTSTTTHDDQPRQAGRKPYTPPVIEQSAVFETLALACAKQAGAPECAFGPPDLS